MNSDNRILLGSASPRRLELLSLLVDRQLIDVVAPDCDELALDEPMTSEEIDDGLRENVRRKRAAIACEAGQHRFSVFADTVVVVRRSDGRLSCLGKPPEENWEATVTGWFSNHYAVGPHWVRTCFALVGPAENHRSHVVETEIRFRSDASQLLPWYLSTGESLGKAGGYGLQGAGSMFAEEVSGSLSNVIGLPLESLHTALTELGFFAP